MRSSDNRDSLSPTWSRAGVWGRLHQKILELPAGQDLVDLSRPGLDAAHVRTKGGGELAGPSPVDRGKPGSNMHVLSDANRLPPTHRPPRGQHS